MVRRAANPNACGDWMSGRAVLAAWGGDEWRGSISCYGVWQAAPELPRASSNPKAAASVLHALLLATPVYFHPARAKLNQVVEELSNLNPKNFSSVAKEQKNLRGLQDMAFDRSTMTFPGCTGECKDNGGTIDVECRPLGNGPGDPNRADMSLRDVGDASGAYFDLGFPVAIKDVT